MLYQQCCEQYRYFLTWRHTVIGGYLAALAALALALKWSLEQKSTGVSLGSSTLVCISGAGLGLVFWLLERRNRKLYAISQIVGKEIEASLGFVTKEPKSTVNARTVSIDLGVCGYFLILDRLRAAGTPYDPTTEPDDPTTTEFLNAKTLYAGFFLDVRRFFRSRIPVVHSLAIDLLFGATTLSFLVAGAGFAASGITLLFLDQKQLLLPDASLKFGALFILAVAIIAVSLWICLTEPWRADQRRNPD